MRTLNKGVSRIKGMSCKHISFHILWDFISIAGTDLTEQYTFATTLPSPTNNLTTTVSCSGRCMEISSRPSLLECKCDHACMFLGDCCYDYLIECDPRDMDPVTAIHEQLSIFQRFEIFTRCIRVWPENYEHRSKVVAECPKSPTSLDDIKLNNMCGKAGVTKTISSYVPVESNGVLFQNMYCAACHGLQFDQINQVIDYTVECSNVKDEKVNLRWLPFFYACKIHFTAVSMKPHFAAGWHRYQDVCKCPPPPYRKCSPHIFTDECIAYRNTSHIPYRNKVCRDCLCRRSARGSSGPKAFFDFTGKQPINKNMSDKTSVDKKCQPGFQIHDDICMSQATSQACYSPKENRHLTDYHVVNLFKSALIIYFQGPNLNHAMSQHKILKDAYPCTILSHHYEKILPVSLSQSVECAFVYLDSMAFSDMSQAMGIDVVTDILPEMNVLRTVLLNHDPTSDISCSGEASLKSMTPHQDVIHGVVHVRSVVSRQRFASNKDPMVILAQKGASGINILAFECQPDLQKPNCSERLQQESLLPMDSCLKYELPYDSNNDNDTILLRTGKTLREDQFIQMGNGTVLICADLYDKMHQKQTVWLILESVTYTISLTCLLTTFMIYSYHQALRTLPGLMLMNLIIALFFAQLLFLLNRWELFQILPIVCQIVASTQHYLWLASFAWMACMSMDIFHCLFNDCTTVNIYTKSKYMKYLLAGWLLPIPFPVIANILTTVTTSTLAYDTNTSCWLATHHGILYLFAIPVLTAVAINILLFFGSVWRLSILLKNASFVGRKEDNKRRLGQCMKLSSWMGISWMFGIIPNFVNVDVLWHLFVVSNALQGVHIFFAFGITGRARVLLKRSRRRHVDGAPNALTAISNISSAVSVKRHDYPGGVR